MNVLALFWMKIYFLLVLLSYTFWEVPERNFFFFNRNNCMYIVIGLHGWIVRFVFVFVFCCLFFLYLLLCFVFVLLF